ncbi:MAG: PEP-CTERM sorting domain-containing protein [Phormidesmis sp.]
MNTAIHFLKAHSLKASLPLLLLVTACGDSAAPDQQADAVIPAADPVLAAATPNSGIFGAPSAEGNPLETPEVTVPETGSGPVSYEDVLPPSNGDATDAAAVAAAVDAAGAAAAVPEPAALAGLVIAAAGLVTLKRQQAAG